MNHRPYRGVDDLDSMTRVLAAGLASSRDSGYMHPGDLQWRAFGPHGFPLTELIEVWEKGGEVLGFGFLESADDFSAQVVPDQRGSELEREILAWCHDSLLRWRATKRL